jgi:glycine/D-amino acid oxidase-like deaminating enzyme
MKTTVDTWDVIVIGAGIVGVASSFFIGETGARVLTLDETHPCGGTTGACDAAVSVATKKPGLMMRLASAGLETYRSLTAAGIVKSFHRRPTYLVATTTEEAEVLERHAEALRVAGVVAERQTGDDMRRLVPGLSERVVAGVAAPDEGHAVGYMVVDDLLRHSRASLLRATPVRRILVNGGRVAGVATEKGDYLADTVVLAAGLGSERLAGDLGLDLTIRPRKGQLAVTERRTALPLSGSLISARYLLSKGSQKSSGPESETWSRYRLGTVIAPLDTGQMLIGATREDGKAETAVDYQALAGILREAVKIYPPVGEGRLLRAFAGIRAAVSDGLPILGPHPTIAGLWLATGFEGDGIGLGPQVGRIVHRLIAGESVGEDLSPLAPRRFLRGEWAA